MLAFISSPSLAARIHVFTVQNWPFSPYLEGSLLCVGLGDAESTFQKTPCCPHSQRLLQLLPETLRFLFQVAGSFLFQKNSLKATLL